MMKPGSMNEYALPFAAWELRLYLDTHPNDERALAAYRQLCSAAGDKCNYACNTTDAKGNNGGGCGCGAGLGNAARGGNDGGCSDGRVWHWVDDPWPWELEANVTGGDC